MGQLNAEDRSARAVAGPGEAPAVREGTTGSRPRTGPARRALMVLAVVAAVVLAADQVTKYLTVTMLADREPVRLLGGGVYLLLTRNSGAAFSLGSHYTFVFPLVTLAVIGWIGWMSLRLRSLPWAIALGLLLGGALGNFTDRLLRPPGPFVGQVVDMISVFSDRGQFFPVFNLADSALVCGVCLAVLLELTGRQRDGRRHTAPGAGTGPTDPGRNEERG